VNLAPGKREENELYNAIPRRHTNRGPYDPRKAISPDFVDALNHLPSDYPDVKLFLFTAEAPTGTQPRPRSFQENLARFPLAEEFSKRDIKIICDDANTALLNWCKQLDTKRARAVVFLDPFGASVEWKVIEAIADTKAVDLWILFPHGAINRMLVVAPLAQLLSDGWEQIHLRRAEYEIRKKIKGTNLAWGAGMPSAVGWQRICIDVECVRNRLA